jgi:hypothetical protein
MVAIAARGGYWYEFASNIAAKFGKSEFISVIVGFGEVKEYFRLPLEMRRFLVSKLIIDKYFDDEVVDFINTSYFSVDNDGPKIRYIRALGANKCFKTLNKFAKSNAKHVLIELAMQLPKEELIYLLNTKSSKVKLIIERRLHE